MTAIDPAATPPFDFAEVHYGYSDTVAKRAAAPETPHVRLDEHVISLASMQGAILTSIENLRAQTLYALTRVDHRLSNMVYAIVGLTFIGALSLLALWAKIGAA